MAPPSKNTLVEVIVAALSTTRLRDVGLRALKGVLLSDPRLSILDGAVDLHAVWELLESQPGFDEAIASPPLCYVKTIEDKLGVAVKLPGPLARLSQQEIMARAVRYNPPRQEIDRIISGLPGVQRTTSTERVPVIREELGGRKKIALLLAALAFLVSGLYLTIYLVENSTKTPTFTRMDPGELSGEIPLTSARRWGLEVHAVLVDLNWLKQPEAMRRRQLERALDRVTARRMSTLIIEDEAGRPRATAQLAGKPPKPYIRFF